MVNSFRGEESIQQVNKLHAVAAADLANKVAELYFSIGDKIDKC